MRILAVAGASGGHIFPAAGFIGALQKKHPDSEALLVIPKRVIKTGINFEKLNIKYISIYPVGLSLTRKNFTSIWNFIKGTLESLKIIINFKPDTVVGFGGIESIPLVLFAWFFRIKTLIHEQNVLPGKANRLLAKFSDKVAVSFEETAGYLKIHPDRVVFCGNPIVERLNKVDKKSALDFFGLDDNKITVLVMGGSLGSHNVNFAFLNAIAAVRDNYKFQVIHISGNTDYDILSKRYKDLSVNVKGRVFSFLQEMQYAYCASDIVVSRGGATTISELLYFRVPAVIIPYPYAYNHQLVNARILENLQAAVIVEDNESTAEGLKNILNKFLSNPDKIKTMHENFNNYNIKYNAADLLVSAIL